MATVRLLPKIIWKLYLPGAIALGVIELTGTVAARRLIEIVPLIVGEPSGAADFLVAFALGLFFILLLLKYVRSRVIVSVFFYLALTVGVLTLAESALPEPAAILAALAVIIVRLGWPRVSVHNAVLTLSLAGIAAAMGISLSPEAAAVLLAVLAFYDILAVYVTRHMATMVRGLIERGAVFALVIPDRTSGWIAPVVAAVPGAGFTLLGTGDLVLPAIFVVSVAVSSTTAALFSGIGSLAGLLFTQALFQSQRTRRPMAALPPIAAGTILGFLISRLAAL